MQSGSLKYDICVYSYTWLQRYHNTGCFTVKHDCHDVFTLHHIKLLFISFQYIQVLIIMLLMFL